MALTTVLALGSNGSGQLGVGHKKDVSVPTPVAFMPDPPASRVLTVVGGGNHSLLLTETGRLYWSGDPSGGACGLVTDHASEGPARFISMMLGDGGHDDLDVSPVRTAAATWEASIFTRLDSQGHNTRIYSCGTGNKGELGQGPLVTRLGTATRIPAFPPADTQVVDLAACIQHVVVVLSNGEAYGWGSGRKGQLGEPAEALWRPRKIEGVTFDVKRAVCGKDFTCLLGAPAKGECQIFGSDKWGVKSAAPPLLPGWRDVGASWSNLFVLGTNGSLLSWGRNDYDQNSPCNPTKISKIAAGSEHAVALLETSDVLAWGWGEHGNCGAAKPAATSQARRNLFAPAEFGSPSSEIVGIAAGCATTWVIVKSKETRPE